MRARSQAAVAQLPVLLLALLLLLLGGQPVRAQPRVRPGGDTDPTCGATGQTCCAACEDIPDGTVCDQYVCDGNNQCYTFADKARGYPPDGTATFPLICMETPRDCGRLGKPCCYNPDPSSESRCYEGLTCIVEGVKEGTKYASWEMYGVLKANNSLVTSTKVMGTCRNLTKSDCGKMYKPCGGAAEALGCKGAALICPAGAYCASPGDTRLGAPRCLPLPPGCGKLDGPCCPANTGNKTTETWYVDKSTPVPFCSDGRSACVWQRMDYLQHGTASFPGTDPSVPAEPFEWDGYFERGYGRSRCAPAPKECGAPGGVCCPSMTDQIVSGMVHNRQYLYQPCNYRAVGRKGIYCKGEWQGSLLKKGTQLGVCTPNPETCGQQVGKVCCLSNLPEVGQVGQCLTDAPFGSYYCAEGTNLCTRCPAANATVAATPYVKRNCQGFQDQSFRG